MVDTAVLEQEGPELKHRHGPFHVDQKKKGKVNSQVFFSQAIEYEAAKKRELTTLQDLLRVKKQTKE